MFDPGVPAPADQPDPTNRDRNHNYVPTGLYLDGRPQYAEISPDRPEAREVSLYLVGQAWELIANAGWDAHRGQVDLEKSPGWHEAAVRWRDSYHALVERTNESRPKAARIAHGQADELNRDHGTWWWVDVSGDGTHWSRFDGHRVQVDIELHTGNRREVNDWKGRDEIRAEGTWTLALNRQPIWEGQVGSDPLGALRTIDRVTRQLLDHVAINWMDPTPVAEQLAGRKVYYDRCPAVISYVSTLNQGCVGLKPVGTDQFPPSMYEVDRGEEDADPYERDEIKVDLLDPRVHWWRDKLVPGVETPAEVESNLVQHARRELALSAETDEPFKLSILAAVQGFASYPGHSGGSAEIAQDMLSRLLRFENLAPLTDDPAEWTDRTEMSGQPWWQSVRNSRAMSHDGGKTYWLVDEQPADGERVMHTSAPRRTETSEGVAA